MSLLNRVATLIRANLNDLVDQAEDPEKLLKQLLLDMQNQYLQLKTQTAIAVAEQHLLEGKRTENCVAEREWMGKAEVALAHNDETLSRAAIERSLTHQTATVNFENQLQQQRMQVNSLRESLTSLEAKMTETRGKIEILVARYRHARIALRTGSAAFEDGGHGAALDRMAAKVSEAEAVGRGYAVVNEPGVQSRLDTLQRNDKIEGLLEDLKRKRQVG